MNRCMCPKPEVFYMVTEDDRGDLHGGFHQVQLTDLHFKKADEYCERCGRGLCAGCSTGITEDFSVELGHGWTWNVQTYDALFCLPCAEVKQ